MQISERIYKYIAERGLSQIEFSKRTGISQSTISDWRRKGTNPSSDKIMVICDVLAISPLELLTGMDNDSHDESQTADYIVLSKESQEYMLVETYRDLDGDSRKRLEGYMAALMDMM